MCVPGIPGKPTNAQLAGFGAGGTGVTIQSFTPTYSSLWTPVVDNFYGGNAPENLIPSSGGTYTLSDGSTRAANELVRENQRNAYGDTQIPATFGGSQYRDLVGQELTAAPQPVQQTPTTTTPTSTAPTNSSPVSNTPVNTGPTPAELAAQRERERLAALEAQRRAEEEARRREAELRRQREEEYLTGRTGILDETRTGVNSAFSSFDDKYFDTFKRDYVSYYNPQLEDQYSSAQDVLELQFARSGGSTNNAAQNRIRELNSAYAAEQEAIRKRAAEAVTGYRGSVDSARGAILSDIDANSGPATLPQGVNDVGSQLNAIRSSLSGFGERAQTAASGITRPGFEDLGPVFSGFTAGSSSSGNIGATSGRDYNTEGLYSARRAPVQKVVT